MLKHKTASKFLIGLLVIVIIAVIISIVVFMINWTNDRPAKLLFGLAEVNTNVKDTVYKEVPKVVTIKPETKTDIVTISRPEKPIKSNIRKDTSTVKNNTTISGGKNHIVTGNNNNVGVNGDQYLGIKQRNISPQIIQYLLSKLPKKDESITFLFAGDKETMTFATQIYNELIARGYSKISPSRWLDPDDFDRVYVTSQNDIMQIRICPASNVQ